jgi:hypothetical protein
MSRRLGRFAVDTKVDTNWVGLDWFGYRGCTLESLAKVGISGPENALSTAASDPRLQQLVHRLQLLP